MFRAELRPAKVFKQIIDALREVVQDVTFQCCETEMSVQAMDSSHVSLVSLTLNAEQFSSYRCESPLSLSLNVGNLAKLLKCGSNDDTVLLSADQGGDTLAVRLSDAAEERVSEFSMKLFTIDSENISVPAQDYKCAVMMNSSEYARICKDLANICDTVTVDVRKEAASFAGSGEIGSGRLTLKAQRGVGTAKPAVKAETKAEAEDKKVKTESGATKRSVDDDDDADAPKKKRRATERVESQGVSIDCAEPTAQQFALRYLTLFSRPCSISDQVSLKLSKDFPLQVEYQIPGLQKDMLASSEPLGTLRYYLAPKVGDADGEAEAAEE